MVAHLLRLRLDLLVGALRGDVRHVVRMTLGLILLAAAVVVACWGVLRLRTVPEDVAFAVTVLVGAAVTLGFAGAPLVAGADDPLDPRRFAVLGLPPRRLAGSLLLAGVVSVPLVAAIALGGSVALLWIARGAAPVLTVLGVALGVATCLLLARASLAIAALVLRERRSRELTGLFLVALLVVVVPVGVFLASLRWQGRVPTQLAEAVEVLALTPVGAPWAVSAGTGDAGPLVVAIGTVAGLAVLWAWLVRRLLTTTERPASVRERHGLGWFAVTPDTPGGAIAARSLVYWLRDPRYLANLSVVPVASIVAVVPLVVVGVPLSTAVLVMAPLLALFLGWIAHNDLAYDSTALWMHVSSAVRGTADRWGRLVPVVLIAVPLLAVAVPVTTWLHGRWAVLPALVGVCVSLFLCGLGLSSVSSVVSPYAVTRPGESPFVQPQRTGGASAQGLVLFGAIALSAPVLWWGWLSLAEPAAFSWITLWLGVGVGLLVCGAGVAIGGRAFDRRGSRLMEFAEAT
ncbi:hypothetical protein [Microbacterium sp.]|uniref:hypothetical protein n=1 Tax=Microbacterium sp. TaxID=51671 RepID=UPI0032215EF7